VHSKRLPSPTPCQRRRRKIAHRNPLTIEIRTYILSVSGTPAGWAGLGRARICPGWSPVISTPGSHPGHPESLPAVAQRTAIPAATAYRVPAPSTNSSPLKCSLPLPRIGRGVGGEGRRGLRFERAGPSATVPAPRPRGSFFSVANRDDMKAERCVRPTSRSVLRSSLTPDSRLLTFDFLPLSTRPLPDVRPHWPYTYTAAQRPPSPWWYT
jgi:hypothetical protein